MLILGLTGSIATGKSFIANRIALSGIPVFDADLFVQSLYKKGNKKLLVFVKKHAPKAIEKNDKINHSLLLKALINKPSLLKKLEMLIHPLVNEDRNRFIKKMRIKKQKAILLDSPLLFEVGMDKKIKFDQIIVAHCPVFIQRRRALKRPFMEEEKLDFILKNQMKQEEKIKRADFSIQTGFGSIYTKFQIWRLLREITNF